MSKAGIRGIRSVAMAISLAGMALAGAARADVAEASQTPAQSLPYWLALSRQRATPIATGKEARLMRMGPLVGADFARGVPTLVANGSVEMLVGSPGTELEFAL